MCEQRECRPGEPELELDVGGCEIAVWARPLTITAYLRKHIPDASTLCGLQVSDGRHPPLHRLLVLSLEVMLPARTHDGEAVVAPA